MVDRVCHYEIVSNWIATGFGALDLIGDRDHVDGADVVVTPVVPGPPVYLLQQGAAVWRMLVAGPVDDGMLDAEQREIARGLADMGLASQSDHDTHRIGTLATPWLASVFHELVYALLQNVAEAQGIDLLFIKGPTLHAQGLRAREHSGDVDCWVRPGDDIRLAKAMRAWGWTPLILPFTGTSVSHSLTLVPGAWGCAIDVHSSFPGMRVDPESAFEILVADSELRTFAGVTTRTPSRRTHAVLSALHDMRPYEGSPPSETTVHHAAEVLAMVGEEVMDVVDRLDAGYVLREPLRRSFGNGAQRFDSSRAPDDWSMRLEAASSLRHFRSLRFVPARHRVRALVRLVWPKIETMRIAIGDPDASRKDMLVARIRRIGTSVRKLAQRR